VAEAIAAARLAGPLPDRGMAAVVADFFDGLAAAGRAPEQATEGDFRRVGTSRSRFRTLMKALERFAPFVPLGPAAPVRADWDRWLNETYNQKPRRARASTRVAHLPEHWPAAWAAAIPALDRIAVGADDAILRPVKGKTRDSVLQAVGMLAAARDWAEGRGQPLGEALHEDLFDAFVRFAMVERGASARTAADYLDRVAILARRGRLLDGAGDAALAFAIGCLREEAAETPPAKAETVRRFAERFDVGDLLLKAQEMSMEADRVAGHLAEAARLRLRAMTFAMLVNGADRQGDLMALEIGRTVIRQPSGLWLLDFRQRKTGGAKELELWPFTSALIDRHILGDLPAWRLDERLARLHGRNLLTLGPEGFRGYPATRWLQEAFGISGHLIRTLVVDALRAHQPDAAWAAQTLLGHATRTMQDAYQTDFRRTAAVRAYHEAMGLR